VSLFQEVGISSWISKPVKQRHLLHVLASASTGKAIARDGHAISAAPAKPVRDGLKILLAEDSFITQKVTLAQLKKLGYEADLVSNGVEALDAVRNRSYHLVFMDCQMPEMDGYEATRRIRETGTGPANPWIVAMTANAMHGDREKCLEAKMNDYIAKPVRMEELKQVFVRMGAKQPDNGTVVATPVSAVN
jgi:CheY-like chemotaxis protein